jgi:hypothetical protein
MYIEMATLYSIFAPRRVANASTFAWGEAEWAVRVKSTFHAVLRHFRKPGVAERRQRAIVAALVTMALTAGCASVGGLSADAPPDVKREAVAARAKARWDALIKLDLAGAYQYLSPASRATMPLDLYSAKHKVGMYRAVKIDNVTCDADACTVKLHVTYDYKRFKGVTTPLVEKWIISQGQAWLVDRG